MTTSTEPLPSTSSLVYSDDAIMPDDIDSYHLDQPLPPLAQLAIKSFKLTRRSQSFDSLSMPLPLPLQSVTEEDSNSLSPVTTLPLSLPVPRPSRPSMPAASKPPAAPSRPSLPAATASRSRPSHKRTASTSTSTSTSGPALLPIKLTPNELETNLTSLAATLHDTTSHEWDVRIAALSQLQSIALGCQLTHSLPLLIQHFRQLRQPLCQQIGDLRSSVVRATCSTLSTIAQLTGQPFSDECDAVIPALLKLVAVSVAVIAQSGDEAVRAMLRFCSPTRGLAAIIDTARGSSSATTRARCMQYVVMWLDEKQRRAQEEAMYGGGSDESRWQAAIDGLIREKLADKTESVRVSARRAAVLYCRLWEESGRRLLDAVEPKVRRMIEEERRRDGVADSCPPAVAQTDRGKETERKAMQSSASAKRHSTSMKAAEEAKATVLPDKENSHPNTAAEQPSTVQPTSLNKSALRRQGGQLAPQPVSTQSAAPASAADDQSPPVPAGRGSRRQSFSLVSLVAADSNGTKRLSGARRVSVAPLCAQNETAAISMPALPPRPPRPSLSIGTRSLSGPVPAATASAVVPPLPAAAAVVPEQSTPPRSPSVVSRADMTALVQAAIEQAVATADTDKPQTEHVRQSSSLPAPPTVGKQVELRELPVETAIRGAGKKTDSSSSSSSNKRRSLGVAAAPATVPASLIPRRSSFSLPTEHKPAAMRPASMLSLLASASEGSWSARVAALQSLAALLPQAGTADIESHLERLVSGLADRMQDSHPRVVAAALSALTALLVSSSSTPTLPPLLSRQLVALLSSLFRVLSRSQQPVKQQCDGLLTALCGVYPGVELLPPLLSLLSASSTLSSAERSHAAEFGSYVCEWGDDELRQTKRDIMNEARDEQKMPVPHQQHSTDQSPTHDTVGTADRSQETEAEVALVDAPMEDENKYDSSSDEEAFVRPVSRSASPPRSLALSPGLARRLAPVLSPPPAAAPAPLPAVDHYSAPEPAPIPAATAARVHTPPSPPPRAQSLAVQPALSFPTHSVFPSPRPAITHPASVEKPTTRSYASTSHQRSLSASSAPSLPAARRKQDATTKQRAKKRISLSAAAASTSINAAAAAAPSVISSSIPAASSTRRSPARALPVSLSDTDVSALIYQWKHADLPVVMHSLHFATQQLSNPNSTPLCNPAIDRIIAAAIVLPVTHPTTTAVVIGLLSVILSPALCGERGKDATRLAAHLQTAAFPHAAGLVELVVTAHARAVGAMDEKETVDKEAVERLWSAVQRYCHRATLVTAIIARLATASPVNHATLTLLLTSLSTLLPSLSDKAVEAVMTALSHVLCLLLSHEQVVVRKQCVSVWVACWRVLGGGVERWMSGLTAVSRRLVDIYLSKAKEEQKAEKSEGSSRP